MTHYLCFWREDAPIPPAADSIAERLIEDRNLPGVDRLSLHMIKEVFRRQFPDITVNECPIEWISRDCLFRVSFSFDDDEQPTIICMSSERSLADNPEVFSRIHSTMLELNCTRVEARCR
jgi:hypothetical protein